MTGPTVPSGPVTQAAFDHAAEELGRLRDLLQRAGRGQVDPRQVQRAVHDFMHDHGDALSLAATSVGEQVRLQVLAQLYQWRTQLAQQRTGDQARRS